MRIRCSFDTIPMTLAAVVALGLSYIGLIDELSIFSRALSEEEVGRPGLPPSFRADEPDRTPNV